MPNLSLTEFLRCRCSVNVRGYWLVYKSSKTKTESVCDVIHFFSCKENKRNKLQLTKKRENLQGGTLVGDLNRCNYDNMHNWLGMWCACMTWRKKWALVVLKRIVVGTKDVCTT